MFTFIHAADVHLDSPLRGLSRYESAPAETIRNACRRAFENLVELAIEEKVSFVLLAGDLYDGDWKDYSTGIFLSHQIGRLGQHDIPVFAVAGNHDAANRMTRALERPANLTFFPAGETHTIRLDQLAVSIHGRSFEAKHVEENLAAGFPLADRGRLNIGLLHTSLDGREGHAVYAPCSVDDLLSKGYQYWALGHVHQQEFISTDPCIVFPGCIQGRHIRETGAKGCLLVSVQDGTVVEVDERPLDLLRWALCQVDLTGVSDQREVFERIRNGIESERASADHRPVAMRIRCTGATPIADDLAAFPEHIEHRIKALGAEIAGDEVWIERVENTTVGQRDFETALSEDSSFGKLLQEILATPANPADISGLKEVIADLRQKIPPEAFDDSSFLNISDDRTIRRLTEEAKRMLMGRLLNTGETP